MSATGREDADARREARTTEAARRRLRLEAENARLTREVERLARELAEMTEHRDGMTELYCRNANEVERLRRELAAAEMTLSVVAVDLHDNGMHPDDAAEELAKACQKAREALREASGPESHGA